MVYVRERVGPVLMRPTRCCIRCCGRCCIVCCILSNHLRLRPVIVAQQAAQQQKRKRARPGTKALREIRKFQKSTDLLIRKRLPIFIGFLFGLSYFRTMHTTTKMTC